jgi:4-oxalmesaconate hydratase
MSSSSRTAAARTHWGRFRGIAQDMKLPLLTEHLLNSTCVHHLPIQGC